MLPDAEAEPHNFVYPLRQLIAALRLFVLFDV